MVYAIYDVVPIPAPDIHKKGIQGLHRPGPKNVTWYISGYPDIPLKNALHLNAFLWEKSKPNFSQILAVQKNYQDLFNDNPFSSATSKLSQTQKNIRLAYQFFPEKANHPNLSTSWKPSLMATLPQNRLPGLLNSPL